ncbi:MAG TPA: hypothetical protein PK280_00765 [Planctomycetota bacterium]|nr:hypothetical protein [Planctomycetota bacterium]
MRATLRILVLPAVGLALVVTGCGPSGGGSEAPAPAGVGKLGEPVKGTAPVPVPSTAPVDAKLQEDARRIATEVGMLPPSPAAAAEGLEAAQGWKLADWEDPGTCRRVEIGRGGNAMMHLATAGGEKGKSTLLLTRDMSLADKGSMRLAVYNTGAVPVRIAVAFWFADSWVYYESQPQDVEPRAWKELSFDLAGTGYKTASSKWAYSASLWKREEAKQLAVLLFSGGKPGAIFIDGAAVDLAAHPAPGPAGARPEGRPGPGQGQGRLRRPPPPPPPPATPGTPAEKPAAPEAGGKVKDPSVPAKPEVPDGGAKAAPGKSLFGEPPPEEPPEN